MRSFYLSRGCARRGRLLKHMTRLRSSIMVVAQLWRLLEVSRERARIGPNDRPAGRNDSRFRSGNHLKVESPKVLYYDMVPKSCLRQAVAIPVDTRLSPAPTESDSSGSSIRHRHKEILSYHRDYDPFATCPEG